MKGRVSARSYKMFDYNSQGAVSFIFFHTFYGRL